jgi:hypothetical protein
MEPQADALFATFPVHNEFFAEIADVRDRSAEAGNAQLEEDAQHFGRRALLRSRG